MDVERLQGVLESVLFVTGDALTVQELAQNLDVTEMELEHALGALSGRYESLGSGLSVKRFGQHVQLSSKAEHAPFIERVLQPVQKKSLSQAAMETLAVVAYRQPITRQEVEAVRGVKCDYSLQSLLQKGLLQEAGRKETLGRPILYATTPGFLAHFGLQSLQELPPLPEGAPAGEALDEVESYLTNE